MKMQEKAELVRRSEAELGRNRELSTTLFDLEAKSRATEDQLAAGRREQDDLRFATSSMQNANADLRAEIDAL